MSVGVMMLLGGVVFSVNSTSYDQITRAASFNWAPQNVIGRQPVYQYLGHGEKTITLQGRVFPGQYGDRTQLLILEQSAGLGLPLPLFTGGGLSLGAWCITGYTEDETQLMDTGDAQSISFTVDLVQYAGLADYLTGLASDYIKSVDLVGDFLDFLP